LPAHIGMSGAVGWELLGSFETARPEVFAHELCNANLTRYLGTGCMFYTEERRWTPISSRPEKWQPRLE